MQVRIHEIPHCDIVAQAGKLNLIDCDAEVMLDISNASDTFYSIEHDGNVVGIAEVYPNIKAYLYLYIDPAYRDMGIGNAAIVQLERILADKGAISISTSYRNDVTHIKAFAIKHGYIRTFSSAYMEYNGKPFSISAPVRQYTDDDYRVAQKLYAEAFHIMRVNVGDFPNSAVAQPSEGERGFWNDTANERYVYIQNNEVVGYSHLYGNTIGSIAVEPKHQGCGIGKAFVKHVANILLTSGYSNIGLYCVEGNPARRLYDSLGFSVVYIADYSKKTLYL